MRSQAKRLWILTQEIHAVCSSLVVQLLTAAMLTAGNDMRVSFLIKLATHEIRND